MDWCETRLDTCVVGGLGASVWERAGGSVLLSGYSNVLLQDCVIQHSGSLEVGEYPRTVGFGVQCVKVSSCCCPVWARVNTTACALSQPRLNRPLSSLTAAGLD